MRERLNVFCLSSSVVAFRRYLLLRNSGVPEDKFYIMLYESVMKFQDVEFGHGFVLVKQCSKEYLINVNLLAPLRTPVVFVSSKRLDEE